MEKSKLVFMGLIKKYSNNYMSGQKDILFLAVGFHHYPLKLCHTG